MRQLPKTATVLHPTGPFSPHDLDGSAIAIAIIVMAGSSEP
jgi:hypothetical protein